MRPGALEREASIDAIWENVLDWEHFPYVHAGVFESVELLELGPWGFRANLGIGGGGGLSELETVIDREARHYVARTRVAGRTVGENWTALDPIGPHRTDVHVEFCVRQGAEDEMARVGEVLRRTYVVLWDQDEAMMQRREQALSAPPADAAPPPLDIGDWAALRADLPRDVEFGGRRFRIAAPDGTPVIYALECPHRLAPLDACPIEGGIVTCPWHGYRFEVASGRSADGRGLRLRPAPRLEIDDAGRARLVPERGGAGPAAV